VVVAEDSYLIREGLRMLFDSDPDIELVGTAGTLPELFDAVEAHEPDVVLTDIRMPPTGYDEGVRAAEVFARTRSEMGVVVLSQYLETDFALRVFDGGARGRAYLLKERVGDFEQLHRAIAAVVNGDTVLDPAVVDALIEGRRKKASSMLDRLTQRELEVLAAMAAGSSNAAIGSALVLSARAVEKHISSILQKLDLSPEDGDVHRRVRAVLVYLSEFSG
jgi:DNA-binding NarL/FixJ family response regulator